MRKIGQYPTKFARSALLGALTVYRHLVSPLLVGRCRFEPSCSGYAVEAISRYGCLRGLRLSVFRLLKCHPFHEGGFDPVPELAPVTALFCTVPRQTEGSC